MTALLTTRSSPAARWSRPLAVFAAVLFLLSGAAHRFGLLETVPFFWLLAIAGSLAAVAFLLALIGFVQIWEHGLAGGRSAVAGALAAMLVLAPYFVSGMRVLVHPRLTDIATDLDRPPALLAAQKTRSGAMNRVGPIGRHAAELQQEHYPAVVGRRYSHARERVVLTILDIVQDRGWRVTRAPVRQRPGAGVTVEALAHSYFLGFPADVAIRVEDDESATYVDMRSASRYGAHDLGDNALRIRRFLDELDERMSGLAGI